MLKDSTVLAALRAAWHEGAVVVGAGAGAATLTDPMVDPRGGAFSVGLGLLRDCAVVTGYRGEPTAQLERTLALAPAGCAVIALPDGGGVVRAHRRDVVGGGEAAAVFVAGTDAGLAALAGKPAG